MDEDGNELEVREDDGDGDDEDDNDEGDDNDDDGDDDDGNEGEDEGEDEDEDEDEDEALNLGPVFSWLFGDVDAMDGPAPEPTGSGSKVTSGHHYSRQNKDVCPGNSFKWVWVFCTELCA